MKTHIFASVVLLLFYQDVCGALEVKPSANPAVEGESVTLSLSPPTTLNSGSWAVGDVLILTWTEEQVAVFSNYSGRASINANRELTLSSVRESDSGLYTLKSTDPALTASLTLTVLEAVSNVTVNASELTLIEHTSAVAVSCSVSTGSSVSFAWFNGSSEVRANDRVRLTDGNSTLSVLRVTRYDQGPFTCSAFNSVSNGTSDPLNFNVCYGPDNMRLMLGSHVTGSNVTAVCSAESNPPAQMQWAFKDELLNTTGSVLELYNVTTDRSGYYSCLAFNNETNLRHNVTGFLEIKDANSQSEQPTASLWLLPLLSFAGMVFSICNI